VITAKRSQTAQNGVFQRWIMREGKRKEGGTERMKEYIEREAAICRLREAIPYYGNSVLGLGRAIGYLQAFPAADVEEVQHGRWEPDEFWRNHDVDYCVCSACQKYWIHNGDQYDFNYCPNCGAKMDGGVNDAAD